MNSNGGMTMNVCVYGASSNRIDPIYLQKGFELGQALAKKNWTLIFGGGNTGMMGASIRGINSLKGKSIGIAPHFFKDWEALSEECTEFIFTNTMRERKEKMEQLADAFIMSPGGIGTYEEFFEILTLRQLKQLDKPICIFNINGAYDQLNQLLIDTVKNGFMQEECLSLYFISSSIEDLFNHIETFY